MNLKWYLNRMRSMSIQELFFYRTIQILNIKLLFRIKLFFFKPYALKLNPNFKGPKYSVREVKKLFELYEWSSDYSFFDTIVNIDEPVIWRKDYKNNIISKKEYSGKINRQDFNIHGDVKYVSELSRMHFLPFLAFKTICCKTDSKSILKILKSWERDNPFMESINYTSGIEVAIRSVNLVHTHHILNSFNSLTAETDKLIKKIIAQNYFFLKNHLSLYSSANNHLVAELTGLTAISSYFEGRKIHKSKWKKKLLKKITAKYNKDGMDDELSMRYHLAVTDHFVNGLNFISASGLKINQLILSRLKTVYEFSKHINYLGNDSNFGDNDDSFLINPFFDSSFSYSNSILESLNILCNKSKVNDRLDFRNYLIFGEQEADILNQRSPKFDYKSSFFKDSGYAFLYDVKSKIKLTFDFGNIGDNRLMAHGHSDQLSFTLQKDKYRILVNPGTYQYHKKENKWRQYFRSIQAHNCISFKGMNHAMSLGRMSWIKSSKITHCSHNFTDIKDSLKGTTNAFEREGLNYTREVVLNRDDSKISIVDDLKYTRADEEKGFYYLHFHPDITIEHKQNIIYITTLNGDKIKLKNTIFKTAKLIKGDEHKPFGWYSEKYDKKQESFSLISEFIVKKDIIITTEIFY